MNYLSGAIHYIKGSEAPPSASIPRLVDRIASSPLPRDRREALTSLTLAATDSPVAQSEVGESAIKVIYAVFEQDREFDDTLRAVLELLVTLCGVLDFPTRTEGGDGGTDVVEDTEDARRKWERASASAAATNTDAFLGLPDAMPMLLDVFETGDVFLKCSAIEVLTAMAVNSRATVQASVLAAPEAVARLADLLGDSNAIVRTNATLLLSALAEESVEICKIIAFSGVLDSLFRVLSNASAASTFGSGLPGASDDGKAAADAAALSEDADPESAIAVADSLQLVRNLLKGSPVTQTFMRDSGCIPRLAQVLSHAASRSAAFHPATQASLLGPAKKAAEQNHANVVVALECVRLLVAGDAADADRNRTACAAAGIVRTVLQLCFALPAAPAGAESARDELRVNAMLCGAELVSGHEEVRGMFAAPMSALGGASRSRPPQLVAAEVVTGDESAAVRAAANVLLTSSLLADTALNLPATALLNALVTDSGSTALGGGAVGSAASGGSSPLSGISGVAAMLKENLVGWPNDADGAGVFYVARNIGWVCARLRGARERLLGAHVSGSGDVLLSRTVRCLGQAVREEGPPAVRVGLLRLICTWLYSSPSAVSAFLSSAMHLPLIMELVTKEASRSDGAIVAHTQGLAALVLGICLETVDWEASSSVTDGGFISGGAGASTVVPRSTLVDIVRNRIGVAKFTARLDELRATAAYSMAANARLEGTGPLQLLINQKKTGRPARGDLGHELWYDVEFAELIDEVYSKVSTRVLDLVADERPSQLLNGQSSGGGGAVLGGVPPVYPGDPSTRLAGGDTAKDGRRGALSAMPSVTPSSVTVPLIESSSKDEVLVSYKELIRSQDASLAESRTQLQELEAALREAQLELDAKNRAGADGAIRTEREELKAANALLTERASALEVMVQEKTDEFAALSEAYSALEAMGGGGEDEDTASIRDQAHRADVDRLQREKSSALAQFYAECDKVTRLENLRSTLQRSEEMLRSQLLAVEGERDALRSSGGIVGDSLDGSDAAEWRRRALAGENQVASLTEGLKNAEDDAGELRARIRSLEVASEDASSRAAAMSSAVDSAQAEVEQLQAARKRESQIAKEAASAADLAAKEEVEMLRREVEELRVASNNALPRANDTFSADLDPSLLAQERDSAVQRAESAKEEVTDLRNAVAEWKERAITAEQKAENAAERLVHEQDESRRLAHVARVAQSELDTLRADTTPKLEDLSTATRRVTELEEQCADLEEIRARSSEELDRLKEENASLAEQIIRLSGQVYEADESRVAVEEKLRQADVRMRDLESEYAALSAAEAPRGESPLVDESTSVNRRSSEDEEYISALSEEIMTLKEKLSGMQERLDDAHDKEVLSSAIARDRDDALQKLAEVEKELIDTQSAKGIMQSQIEQMEDRLLILGEAEEAKRVLTAQVGELQKALDVAETSSAQPPVVGSKNSPRAADPAIEDGMIRKDESIGLRTELDEKSLRIDQLESSLKTFADEGVSAGRKISQLEKQLTESEALLSVVSAEKTEHVDQITRLETEIDSLRKQQEELIANVNRLEDQASSMPDVESDRNALEAELETANRRLKELSDLETSLDSMKKHLASKELEVTSLTNEKENLLGEIRALESEERATLTEQRKRVEVLEYELQTVRKDLRTREDELEVAIRNRDASPSTGEVESARRERDDALRELSALGVAAKEADKEISELKLALSDAAKSFTSSRKELAQREELLVEISRDKTAVTNDLERAKETIESLREDSAKSASAFAEERAQLSEQLAAVEKHYHVAAAGESGETASSHSPSGASLVQLSRTAVLVSEVENKFSLLEEKHSRLIEAAANDKKRIDSLVSELNIAKQTSGSGDGVVASLKAQLATQSATNASELGGLRAQIVLQTKELEAKSTQVVKMQENIESLRVEVSGLRETVAEAKSTGADLARARDESLSKVSKLESELAKESTNFSNMQQSMDAKITEVEGKTVALELSHKKSLDSKAAEISVLSESLRKAREEAECTRKEYESQLNTIRKRVEDLEAEVDSGIESLEAAERKLRDSTAASQEAARVSAAAIEKLQTEKHRLEGVISEKENVFEESLSARAREKAAISSLLDAAKEESSQLSVKLQSSEKLVVSVERDLRSVRAELVSSENRLAESASRNTSLTKTLDSANEEKLRLQDTISKLESCMEERNSTISEIRAELERIETLKATTDAALSEETRKLAARDDEVQRLSSEIDRLRQTRGRLEEEVDSLHAEVDTIEAARSELEKDNSDLRAWVKDLEQQANGLQELANKFEDVEQSLDEAVAAHQAAMDANSGLTARVETLGAELEEAQSTAKTCRTEKDSAETASALAKRQMEELDSRLQEIRTSHAGKLAATEDKIRSNVARTAELESALATAERQLAESATLSDRIFSMETELARARTDAASNLSRAEAAAAEADAARREVSRMEKEVVAMRNSTGGEAYAELEAEHNELLMCLAELELEHTALKDTATHGQGTTSIESVSAR